MCESGLSRITATRSIPRVTTLATWKSALAADEFAGTAHGLPLSQMTFNAAYGATATTRAYPTRWRRLPRLVLTRTPRQALTAGMQCRLAKLVGSTVSVARPSTGRHLCERRPRSVDPC